MKNILKILTFLTLIFFSGCSKEYNDILDNDQGSTTDTSIDNINGLFEYYDEDFNQEKALFTITDNELKIQFGDGFISGQAEKIIIYEDQFIITFSISNTSENYSNFNGLLGEIDNGQLEILDSNNQSFFKGYVRESANEEDLTKSRIVVNILDNCRAVITVNGSSLEGVGGPIYMSENEDLANLLIQAEVYEDFENAQDNSTWGNSSFTLQSGRDIQYSSCNSASFFVPKGNTYSINVQFDDGYEQTQSVEVDKAGITHFIQIVKPTGTGLGIPCLPDGLSKKISNNTLEITSTEGESAADEELHIHPGFFSKVSEGSTIIAGPFNGKLAQLSFFRIKNENGILQNQEYDLSNNELTVHRDFQYDNSVGIIMTAIDGTITISPTGNETNIFFNNVVFENNLMFLPRQRVTITGTLTGVF
jgi:hypothetical protein